MIVYDYFIDIGKISFWGVILLLLVLVAILIWQIVALVMSIKSEYPKFKLPEIITRLMVILLILLLFISMLRMPLNLYSYYNNYMSGNYSVIVGQLNDVTCYVNGGRGDYYDVSFNIDNQIFFVNNNISTSESNAERIKSFEGKNVSVLYSFDGDQYFIFKIECLNN